LAEDIGKTLTLSFGISVTVKLSPTCICRSTLHPRSRACIVTWVNRWLIL